ncbi:hypothetical protein Fmac_026814 [Flemingia macrophylla]|uniref:Reticulon domain-containing protein n=1 Tax=Flemingia macrophylla TaxID=520843 RepID=A0ABD1LFX4_9FABA
MGILLVTLAVWVVLERSGYTFLSLASNILLLLIVILFLWAKSAAILNRASPNSVGIIIFTDCSFSSDS